MTLSPESAKIKDEVGSELHYGGVVATTGKRLRGELDVVGSIPLSKQPLSVEVLAGRRYVVSPSFEVYGIAGLGLGKAPGTPAFRVLVGGSYGNVIPPALRGTEPMTCDAGLPHSPRECPNADDDGDGFLNKDDKCPRSGNETPAAAAAHWFWTVDTAAPTVDWVGGSSSPDAAQEHLDERSVPVRGVGVGEHLPVHAG